MSTRPAAILINPVLSGSRALGRHAAKNSWYWYFADNNILHRISRKELLKVGAHLADAVPITTPPGELQGFLCYKNALLAAFHEHETSTATLYVSSDGQEWTVAGEMKGRIGPWCISADGAVAFMVEDPWDKHRTEPRGLFASEDGRVWERIEEIALSEAEHVHCICCLDSQLVVLVGDAHFRHFNIKVLDETGSLLKDRADRMRTPLGLDNLSLFRVLPHPSGGVLFALDGATKLFTARGEPFLEDVTTAQSGFQVAAHASFQSAPGLLFFGTWRRNQRHPYPCLYVLSGQGLLKHLEKSTNFSNDLSWTGYQDMDASFHSSPGTMPEERFWPCCRGISVCIAPLDKEQADLWQSRGVQSISAPFRGIWEMTPPLLIFL